MMSRPTTESTVIVSPWVVGFPPKSQNSQLPWIAFSQSPSPQIFSVLNINHQLGPTYKFLWIIILSLLFLNLCVEIDRRGVPLNIIWLYVWVGLSLCSIYCESCIIVVTVSSPDTNVKTPQRGQTVSELRHDQQIVCWIYLIGHCLYLCEISMGVGGPKICSLMAVDKCFLRYALFCKSNIRFICCERNLIIHKKMTCLET